MTHRHQCYVSLTSCSNKDIILKKAESAVKVLRKLSAYQFSVIVRHTFPLFQIAVDLHIFAFFSSPEHKVLMVSYCGQSLSVVRRLSSVRCQLFAFKVVIITDLGQRQKSA